MLFDIRTLLVAVTLATAFCAGARFLLWRMHVSLPGLGRWALGGASAVMTFALILAYGKFHWPFFLSLAQLFVVAALMLNWDGFRRFLDQPPLRPVVLMSVTALAWLWILVAQVHGSVSTMAIGNAVLIAILSLLIARELFLSPQRGSPAVRATGCMYAINAAVFLFRAFVTQDSPELIDPLNPNGVAAFMLFWLLCSIIAITLGMVLMTAERLQTDLDHQANHDPLTGALNRRSCALLFKKAVAHSRRHQLSLSVLMIDLDEFKKVNDCLGHDFGDQVLCRFVAIAQQELRDDDILCRFGGEEFVAVLPNTSIEAALTVANRLRSAFAIHSPALETRKVHEPFAITASIGVAELKQDEYFEGLLRRADQALYQAKDSGRNCCELAG